MNKNTWRKLSLTALITLGLISLSMIQSRASFVAVGLILFSYIVLQFTIYFKENNKLKQLKVGNPQNGDGIYQIVTHSSSQTNLTDLEVYNITSSIDVSNYPNLNYLKVENNNRNICPLLIKF